jgi:plasmid maintenance system antidote protein VapI
MEKAEDFIMGRPNWPPRHPGEFVGKIMCAPGGTPPDGLVAASKVALTSEALTEIMAGKAPVSAALLNAIGEVCGREVAGVISRMQGTYDFFHQHDRRPTEKELTSYRGGIYVRGASPN